MDANKMREEFEQWAKDRYSWHLHDDARDPEDRTLASWNGETYGNRIVEGMWQAWQASREAVAVVLPDEEPGYMYYAPDVLAAIEAQGLKVAP
ncbi:hypothetical protein ACIPZ5_00920 [Pseudomonas sp. NPDC089428]|uniref:hypothetical protein n=1 Tax=Pseudomonas sp. NPDC089428 TaxID=3364467 RepID=UPI00382D870B